MLEVTVERDENKIPNFEVGDLVEYPDGEIVLITEWDDDDDDDEFEGVLLKSSAQGSRNIGYFSDGWNKNPWDPKPGCSGPLKKFNGKLILEQYLKDGEEE